MKLSFNETIRDIIRLYGKEDRYLNKKSQRIDRGFLKVITQYPNMTAASIPIPIPKDLNIL